MLISQISIHAKEIHKSSIPSIGFVTIRKTMYNEANFTVDWYKQELRSYGISSMLQQNDIE